MRAVAIARAGPPETLEAIDAPEPAAGPGRIVIRVHRAGVNFADILARQGIYPDAPKPPFVPGYEVSGRGFFGVNILRIFDRRPEIGVLLLRRAFELARSGKAKPVIAAEVPLENAGEAHRLLEGRATIGKVLLAVRD